MSPIAWQSLTIYGLIRELDIFCPPFFVSLVSPQPQVSRSRPFW